MKKGLVAKMPINTIIRNKRKELDLTQEQIADYLGVSAPAVNKWEKGVTSPDISLLAPLARILKIDLNTLLCFEEGLTSNEIAQFSKDVITTIEKIGFQSGFSMVNERIKQYPTCVEFIEAMAVLLEGALLIYGTKVENKEFYEDQINSLYERAANGDDEKIRNKALYMLVSKSIQKKDYDKAQQMLDLLPERSALDKKQLQARLLQEQNKLAESSEIWERKLLAELNEIHITIISLLDVELAAGNNSKAEKLSSGLQAIVKHFDLWDYNAYIAPLQIATKRKNVTETVSILRSMLENLMNPWTPQDSILYNHLLTQENSNTQSFTQPKGDAKQQAQASQRQAQTPNLQRNKKFNSNLEKQKHFGRKLLPSILSDLNNNPDYEFLRSNQEFVELVKEYCEKCEKSVGKDE